MRRTLPICRLQSGFTLIEVLLALALMAILGAVAWPVISNAYVGTNMRSAAQQIQSEWGKARIRAVSSGLPHVFRFDANAGTYSIVPWQDENAALEISTPIGSVAPASSGTSATTTYTGAATTVGPKLPEGMVFVGIQRGSDIRTLAAETQLGSAGIVASSPPVVFYPDGTSSDATLTITNQKGRYVSVMLRGLTGVTRVGEVTNQAGVTK